MVELVSGVPILRVRSRGVRRTVVTLGPGDDEEEGDEDFDEDDDDDGDEEE